MGCFDGKSVRSIVRGSGADDLTAQELDRRKSIRAQAVMELEGEAFREAVEREKERLVRRRDRPWWRYLFPFRITIERIDL